MFKQSKQLLTLINSFSSVLKFAALSVLLLFVIASCDDQSVDPQAGSELMPENEESRRHFMPSSPQKLASGLLRASGSTVGPDGALYVAEGAVGRISRVDPSTGEITPFASGLPPAVFDVGGVTDVVFLGGTAYAIVSIVGTQFGADDVVGLYRIDGPDNYTVIADLGEFTIANPAPPEVNVFILEGVFYSIEVYRGAFLITDGHYNRVLHVTRQGDISIMKQFGNIVPTGLETHGFRIFMTQAGPTPHLPEDGKLVSFGPRFPQVRTVATGARLLVDVEFNRGRSLFVLSQGEWDGVMEGSPAIKNDGSLLLVNRDGSFSTIANGLDRPTSMEFIRNTAYIVTLSGEVWTVKNAACPPFGF